MKWLKAILVVQLAFAMYWSSPRAWSQDDGLTDEIEAAEGEESDLAEEIVEEVAPTDAANAEAEEEDVSFDDFEEKTEQKAEAKEVPAEEPASNEEMTLEPLQGDEDQVTDVPEEPKKEPTPEEFTPPPPTVAEPSPTPTPEPSVLDDSPDLAFEARLHDIYLNYHSKKLTDEEWSQLLGSRESESYTIQRGDTLWNISKTFFNDGNYWPKIWQLNSAITNPHLIQPGNTIRFLLGTESDTPAFAVTEASDEPVEMPVGDAGAAGLEPEGEIPKPKVASGKNVKGAPSDEVEIPPPSEEYRPVLKKIPPSLPEWFLQRRGELYDDSGIDYGRRRILDLPDKKYLESFVDDEDFKAEGEVSEIEGGGKTAANFQYVFLTLPSGQGKAGDQYTVIRKAGQLKRVSKEVATSAGDMGYQYQVQGQVRLEDLLSSSSSGRDIYRAFVVKSLGQIETGSVVVRGTLPTLSLKSDGPKTDIQTQIVGAHQISEQKTLSLHSLAYLAGGAAEGLQLGQILTVRANTRVRNSTSIIKESYIPVGMLKVVRVGEKFTTAIVLKVWDAIFVGDVTGAGKVVPPEPPERRGQNAKTTAKAAPVADDMNENFDAELDGELDEDDFGGDAEEPAQSDDTFEDFEGLDE
ncbi:MAG: LysM peptidoglycan-binding domain-containing protein [Bdellovibrionales bacterium]